MRQNIVQAGWHVGVGRAVVPLDISHSRRWRREEGAGREEKEQALLCSEQVIESCQLIV